MAEALGAVASVLQLISVTAKLVQYCTDVAHAPAEADELVAECSVLTPLLLRLKKDDKLQNDEAARLLIKPLNDLKKRIDDLADKLRPDSRLRKLSRDMLWPLLKKEMREVMERATNLTSLINSWMTSEVKDLAGSIKEDTAILPDMAKTIQKTLSMTAQNERRQTREIMNAMVNYFSPVSFSEKQNEIFSQRQPGTGQWFIDSPMFQEWLVSPGATLWCPGAPGSGKTFIASIVVDYLQGVVKQERDTGLTYVYCDFRRRIQEPTTLLANIWTQLMLQRELSKTEVDQLNNDLYGRRVKLSAAQINGLVEREFTDGKFQRMFVVIDALDECNEAQREALLDHISRLYPWANVLITSRVMGSDLERFTDVRVLRIVSAEVDMHAYIRTRITSSRKLAENIKRKPELENEIVRVVSERAQGLFLLCKLHMDSLALESTPKAVRKVLEGIPTGDTAMKDTYNNAVQRIESQHPSNREWAMRTIQWICFAMRPLTSTELTHALAIDEDDTELSEDNIVSTDLLVEYCGGLVVIEPETKIVRFVHFTTQEYFEGEKNTPMFAGTDGSIAFTCITFLAFHDRFLDDSATLPAIKYVQEETPFLEYAATYFGKHYHKMLSHPDTDTALRQDILDAMCRFFQSIVKVHRAAVSALYTILRTWQVWPGAHHPVGNLNVSAIDIGAFYGVITPNDPDAGGVPENTPLTVQWFTRHTGKLAGEDRQSFGNALHWAALGNSVDSINTLLQSSSLNLDTQEINTWAVQPAHVSAVFSSVGTLRSLLEHSELNVTSRVGDNLNWTGTILHLAIRSVGSRSVAEKIALIDTIVEKDVQGKLMQGYDIYGANPLVFAVKESEHPVVERVLRYFDAVAGDSIWRTPVTADRFTKTPLHWAVMDPSFGFKNRTVAADSGPLLKLKTLLDHPLAWQLMQMRDNKSDVPFEEAVRQSNIHAVEYMITKAAEHKWPIFDQLLMSALYLSVEVADWTVVELLLSKVGLQQLTKPDQNSTVLHHAASGTSRGAMKFLLKKLKSVGLHNVRDNQRMTPLHIAALTGNLDAVEALLEIRSLEIDARDKDGDTPLHLAAMYDIGDACAKLLVGGADGSIKNDRGLTALALALERRAASAVQSILMSDKSAKLDEKPDGEATRWLEDQPWGKHLLDGAGPDSPPSLQHWPRHDGDIITVALCLQKKFQSAGRADRTMALITRRLHGNLAAYILDLASYWVKTTSTRVGVNRRQVLRQWHHPNLPFLISRPVRGRIESPVRRVEFTIVSHDQGYSDDPGLGSWTWFVAEAAQAAFFGETFRDGGGYGGVPSTQGPIEICRNQIATRHWCTHRVAWDVDCCDEARDTESIWVRSLRPENVIFVKPMVMFPGWENWVQRVTIEVYTSCLQSGEDRSGI
ncbi:hypothetical protein SAMD00023353_5900170 [Rosellinia necatrix]|uniref:Uncharacterized protein n=1 Tax=Rosellinia necatrix TaxID=77044 RepID=A0A1W2TVG7_ROSNE|nr:hypothetical protein SAMD00023353_5900170 [Rosellinia necatrix]